MDANCVLPSLIGNKLAKRRYGLTIPFDNGLFQKFYINRLECETYNYFINQHCLPINTCEPVLTFSDCINFIIEKIAHTFIYTEDYLDNPYYATQILLSLPNNLNPNLYTFTWIFDENYFSVATGYQNGQDTILLDIVDLTQYPFLNTTFSVIVSQISEYDCPVEEDNLALNLNVFKRPCQIGMKIGITYKGDGTLEVTAYPFNNVGNTTYWVRIISGANFFIGTGTLQFDSPIESDLIFIGANNIILSYSITDEKGCTKQTTAFPVYVNSCEDSLISISLTRVGNVYTFYLNNLPTGVFQYQWSLTPGATDISFNILPELISDLENPSATVINTGSFSIGCLLFDTINECYIEVPGYSIVVFNV